MQQAQIFRGNVIYDLFVPASWADFVLFWALGLLLLGVSAHLAGVRVGSFPTNPLRWHHWVMVSARCPPMVDESHGAPRIYRPYLYFWAASICCFIAGMLVLMAMLIGH